MNHEGEYQESLEVRVRRFLWQEGFYVSDRAGYAELASSEKGVFGILKERPPQKYLFGLITIRPRRAVIGLIRFDGAEWLLEIFGRHNVESLKQLAQKITSTFGVNVSVRLTHEFEATEQFLGDL